MNLLVTKDVGRKVRLRNGQVMILEKWPGTNYPFMLPMGDHQITGINYNGTARHGGINYPQYDVVAFVDEHELTIRVEVPDGYELTGEFRIPVRGERVLFHTGQETAVEIVTEYMLNVAPKRPRIIVRRAWIAPSWIPDGAWVYQTPCNEWFMISERPKESSIDGRYYHPEWKQKAVPLAQLAATHRAVFNPPPVNCIQVLHA